VGEFFFLKRFQADNAFQPYLIFSYFFAILNIKLRNVRGNGKLFKLDKTTKGENPQGSVKSSAYG
jgi:hypothetical protein